MDVEDWVWFVRFKKITGALIKLPELIGECAAGVQLAAKYCIIIVFSGIT